MITETLSALTGPAQGVLEPIQKLSRQAVITVEQLAARQLDSLKTYADLGVGNIKAAAEVRDIESLQAFMSKQTDVVRSVADRFVADAKAVAEMGVDFISQTAKVGAMSIPEAPAKATPEAS